MYGGWLKLLSAVLWLKKTDKLPAHWVVSDKDL